MNERIRLLELLIGLSGATDLGMGLQAGESVCSAALAAGLARALELDDEGVREALYSTLLLHLGCSAYAHERSAASATSSRSAPPRCRPTSSTRARS